MIARLQGSACAISVLTEAGYCANEVPRSPCEHVADIDEELLPHRLVEAELLHVVRVDLLQLFTSGAPTASNWPTMASTGLPGMRRGRRKLSSRADDEDHEGPCHLASDVSRQRHVCAAFAPLCRAYRRPMCRPS